MTPDISPEPPRIARRLAIGGVVQGVGFRPFVYKIAALHRIVGWVRNDASGVEIHAEGRAPDVEAFVAALRGDPPPAARIIHFYVSNAAPAELTNFEIRPSRRGSPPTVRIAPDLAICADCLAELSDPSNRRYGYPYINCTNCGPRFSIVEGLPYDRANTTMRAWPLCPQCRNEYENPLDRRYHAQPVACRECGPNYRLVIDGEAVFAGPQAIGRAGEMLLAGGILAIKGIGGYHLACSARRAETVAALRTRKFRKEKPFALLVRTLDEARSLANLSPEHERLLQDVSRPIVLAPAKIVLSGVAPDNPSLGIMLPYAPLHHLLFAAGAPSPLVLTSANRSSEPIAYRDDDAQDRLAGIADAFLIGERPIARRVDDSVVAVRAGRPFPIRRARGLAPAVVARLPTTEPLLALGADLKNAIALVVDGEVIVSQHIGDLGDCETDAAFAETIRDLLAMYAIDPAKLTVVHDLHPQFTSTRLAATLGARRLVAVQHHRAHVASVLAEHGLFDEPVVGVAWDGTGFGDDGTIWGGEFFVGSLRTQGLSENRLEEGDSPILLRGLRKIGTVPGGSRIDAHFERVAWLRPVSMPGGDAAARFPVQAAAAFLADFDTLPEMSAAPFGFPRRFYDARALVAKNVRCFGSTSVGRLCDAAAALVGFVRETTFEGQAAIWLESLARSRWPQEPYPLADLDHRALFAAIVDDRIGGRNPAEIAAAFHAALAQAAATQILQHCDRHGLATAALSGGVFQNELLLDAIRDILAAERPGLRLLVNEQVPANDGGIALGQAALAAVSG